MKACLDDFFKCLSKELADWWYRPYAQSSSLVKIRFIIFLVRAKNRCFRGSFIMAGIISHRVDLED